MNLLDPMLGAIAAPDDATPEEINAALTPIRQQAERRQMMMQGLGALGRTVATAFSPVQEYPQVSPVAAMAMGPNYQSFREGQIAAIDRRQQAAQFEQRNALDEQQLQQQQRMQTQQLLQREKDSANQLRLQKMMHDNRLEAQRQRDQAAQERAEATARAKAEADEAKARQPRIDTRTGQQIHIDPETGLASAMPIPGFQQPQQPVRGGGGGGGNRSATGGNDSRLLWNAKRGMYGRLDENGKWQPVDAGDNAGALTAAERMREYSRRARIATIEDQIEDVKKGDLYYDDEKNAMLQSLRAEKYQLEDYLAQGPIQFSTPPGAQEGPEFGGHYGISAADVPDGSPQYNGLPVVQGPDGRWYAVVNDDSPAQTPIDLLQQRLPTIQELQERRERR